MRQSSTAMIALVSVFLCATTFNAPLSSANMNTMVPPLKTAAGSKAETHNNEGIAHYDQQHWDVAKKHFREAVNSDPASAEAHYNLALTLDKSGDHKTAIDHFQKAKDLGKDNPDIQQSEILQAHLKKH